MFIFASRHHCLSATVLHSVYLCLLALDGHERQPTNSVTTRVERSNLASKQATDRLHERRWRPASRSRSAAARDESPRLSTSSATGTSSVATSYVCACLGVCVSVYLLLPRELACPRCDVSCMHIISSCGTPATHAYMIAHSCIRPTPGRGYQWPAQGQARRCRERHS